MGQFFIRGKFTCRWWWAVIAMIFFYLPQVLIHHFQVKRNTAMKSRNLAILQEVMLFVIKHKLTKADLQDLLYLIQTVILSIGCKIITSILQVHGLFLKFFGNGVPIRCMKGPLNSVSKRYLFCHLLTIKLTPKLLMQYPEAISAFFRSALKMGQNFFC